MYMVDAIESVVLGGLYVTSEDVVEGHMAGGEGSLHGSHMKGVVDFLLPEHLTCTVMLHELQDTLLLSFPELQCRQTSCPSLVRCP